MKYIISERQYKLLTEDEDKILDLPSIDVFGDWEGLQAYLKKKGFPRYRLGGDLILNGVDIESLGKLVSVDGKLEIRDSNISDLGDLESVGRDCRLYVLQNLTSLGKLKLVGNRFIISRTNIEDLGNLEYVGESFFLSSSNVTSLGKLEYVGENLDIDRTYISDLGNLNYVGGYITMVDTPLSKTTTKQEIRAQVNNAHQIYL
jgi:hypothetical protein